MNESISRILAIAASDSEIRDASGMGVGEGIPVGEAFAAAFEFWAAAPAANAESRRQATASDTEKDPAVRPSENDSLLNIILKYKI